MTHGDHLPGLSSRTLAQHSLGRFSAPALKRWERPLCILFGVSIPILIPYIHLGVVFQLWDQFTHKVDKVGCTCSCWDTVFKGNYEMGVSGYKHVYFNVTKNTFKIWIVVVLGVIALYETAKRIVSLTVQDRMRLSMLILFCSIVYPHYYGWWSYFNYWNDEYYEQWNHQTFFTLTELVSTVLVVQLMDWKVAVTPRKLLVILNIAVLHVLVSGFDQFVRNVIQREGALHQVLRDLGLMLPDILHILVPLLEMQLIARQRKIPTPYLVTTREFAASVAFVGVGWILCWFL